MKHVLPGIVARGVQAQLGRCHPTGHRDEQTARAVPTATTEHVLIRSTAMHVIHEQLARAHCAQRLAEARQEQRVNRVLAARRTQRKAEAMRLRAVRARQLMALQMVR